MSDLWPILNVNSSDVYRGGWTNWNDNYYDGGRITMTKQKAELLMIFLGIIFVWIEAGLCSLVTFGLFLYHRRVSTQARSRDALWHQSQTVLRNSGDFLTVGRRYMRLLITYGWRNAPILMRTMPTAVPSFIVAGVFLVALPFLTSYFIIHENGNQVLIKSSNCGLWEPAESDTGEAVVKSFSRRWTTAMQYVDYCYDTSSGSSLCDDFFVTRQLTSSSTKAACPFDKSVCLGEGDRPAFRVTTDDLDTHMDLGLNAPSKHRVKFRMTVTCSPLDLSEPRSRVRNDIMNIMLGPSQGFEETYWSWEQQFEAMPTYSLYAMESHPDWWEPIEELKRVENALLSVVFLTNPGLSSVESIEDPFFNMTRLDDSNGFDAYYPPAPITAMGCIEQFAFSNPSSDLWTEPLKTTGFVNSLEEQKRLIQEQTSALTDELELNTRQSATLQLLLWSLNYAGPIGQMLGSMGTSALRALKDPGTAGLTQYQLPDNQWEKEVQYWVNIQLASLQQQFVQFGTGPHNTSGMVKGLEEAELLCGSQLIRHSDFKNYRRSFLISLAAIGGFLIFAPWIIFKIVYLIGRRRASESIMEWLSYSDLHLLRLANEKAGSGPWERCDYEVPYSESGNLARLRWQSGGSAGDQESGGPKATGPRMVLTFPQGDRPAQVTEVSTNNGTKI